TKGTKLPEVVTGVNGDYTFVNLPTDTYVVEVSLSGFKTAKIGGISVSPGDRKTVPALTLEIGGMAETVDVKGEAPVVQATSGERSFTIESTQVDNLPVANRGFSALAALAPGMNGTSRIGGGGSTNFLVDGMNGMDSGNNGILLQINTESIAEVKVLV